MTSPLERFAARGNAPPAALSLLYPFFAVVARPGPCPSRSPLLLLRQVPGHRSSSVSSTVGGVALPERLAQHWSGGGLFQARWSAPARPRALPLPGHEVDSAREH